MSSNDSSSSSRPHLPLQEEETTAFRSIPLAPRSASALPSLKPLGANLPPLGKRSLASLKPPTSFAAPASAPVQSWKINASDLPAMPDYPLERTHMTCSSSITVEEIAQRIARVLASQTSLVCAYDEPEQDEEEVDCSKGRVVCTTGDDFKMIVQLYKTETNQVVVEAQRRKGDALMFSQVRKPLFQMLQTGSMASTAPRKFTPPPFVPNKKFRVMPPMQLMRSTSQAA